jgi:hypothetical protein
MRRFHEADLLYTRLFAGTLSDRLGRRPLVLAGYGLSAVLRPLMGLVATPLAAVLVRTADRFGKGIRSAPRDALVTDLVEPAIRGRAFGHIRAMDHAGAALGPLVAMLFLLAFPGRERTLFLLAILPGLATLAVIWRFVRDPPRRTATTAPASAALSAPQLQLLACVALWALGAASELFLLRRAEDLGVAAYAIPLVWFAIGAVKSLTASRAGAFVDRLTPRPALVVGWLAFAAAYGGLAVSEFVTKPKVVELNDRLTSTEASLAQTTEAKIKAEAEAKTQKAVAEKASRELTDTKTLLETASTEAEQQRGRAERLRGIVDFQRLQQHRYHQPDRGWRHCGYPDPYVGRCR